MARQPMHTENLPAVVTDADLPGLPAMVDAANQIAVMHEERQLTVRAVAAQLGYQLPADCTDPDLIQRDIAANMRRSVEACLEVGRGLRVLKEACGHGNFIARLDVLDIEVRVAQRFMATAMKFSNAVSTPLLKAAGNQTKLFEMLVLDDEQIEELGLTGQTGELKLDEIATMSVKELRTALRDSRSTAQTREELLDAKERELRSLKLKQGKKVVADTDWPDALEPITDQIAEAGRAIAKAISNLETCRITLMETGQALEADLQPRFEAALVHVAEVYEAALAKAERDITKERVTFDKSLGAYGADGM